MSIGQLPQSFRGYVGLAKESSYATATAPSYFVDATSDGFALDNQPDFQNTTRGRGTYKGEAGPLSDEGSIDLPANPENGLGLLLLAAFGSVSTSGSGPDFVHTFTPAETLDSLSVEVGRDTDVVRHAGAGVNSLELSHTAEDMLTASADLLASTPDGSISAASPTYSDLRNFRFHDIECTINSTNVEADVQDLTFGIENNLTAQFRDDRTAGKLSVGERPITATATLDFERTDHFELFLSGSVGDASTIAQQLATTGLEATWTSPETVNSTNYKLVWNQPASIPMTHEATINQNDLVVEDVEFRAIYDSGIGGEAEVTLTNGVTSY